MYKINKCVLPNGLRVVHLCDDSTRMVTLNLLYGVGARDEQPSLTGMAHLLEHLMFEGSEHAPSYDLPLQQAGGENNAYTNNDITNYYVTLPAANIETACWLEADRMTGLAITPEKLAVQQKVVMEEFKQSHLNQPYGDAVALLRRLAYKKHPYRWPTIGRHLSHIARVTLPQINEIYRRFYHPDNAVLSVVGNVEWEQVRRLAEKWFAPLPAGEPVEHAMPGEPRRRSIRRLRVERNVPDDALYFAFGMCSRLHPDFEVYDLISDILANGYAGRLSQQLVKRQRILSSADAYVTASVDDGLLCINGRLARGVTLPRAEEALWELLHRLQSVPLTRRELERVKNRFESDRLFGRMNAQNLAASLALFEWMGEAEMIWREVEQYRAVTADDVLRVARERLVPANASVLYYAKKESR